MALRWILPLALCHGLLYLILVPPWQHYDEPAHFEYARLSALLHRPLAMEDIDPATNREIADSMYRFRFWPPGEQPDLLSAPAPRLGENVRVHPSLYYDLTAIPIGWLQHLSIETQLYAARAVGLTLYLFVIIIAWRISTVMFPDQPVFHLALPLLVCLAPAFTDIMSAVNNDVLVNFSVAAMLLGCAFLLRDGLRTVPFTLAVLGLVVGLMAKRTAVIALAPFTLALLWAVWRKPIHWWPWIGGMTVVSLVVGASAFQYDVIMMADGPHPLLRARPWLVSLDAAYLRLNIDQNIQSLTDWKRSGYIYPVMFEVAFTTFWQRFGWANVQMGSTWDHATLAVVLAGCAGLAIRGLRARNDLHLWQKRWIWLCLATILAAWCALVVRLHPLPPGGWPFIPGGRYIHLTILPTLWLLLLGFQGLMPKRRQSYSVLGLVLFFLILDTTAWAYTIVNFYYG